MGIKSLIHSTILALKEEKIKPVIIPTDKEKLLNGKVAQVTLNYNSTANDIDNAKYLFNYSANKIIENANNYSTDFEKTALSLI